MKTTLNIRTNFEKLMLLSVMFFSSIVAFAQDATKNVVTTETKTTSTEEWVSNPLYWVIGALVLIILIAIVARGGGKKN